MLKGKKKIIVTILGALLISFLLVSATTTKPVKNVILFISDGTSIAGITLTRWYAGAPLASDEMLTGLVRTYCADSAITDSAPGGSAFSTGFKSHTGYIAVLPDVANMPGLNPIPKGDEKRPVATILEAAKMTGRSTGIIATSNIQHATPAAFSSHYPNRNDYETLGEQQVYNNIDVVLGGGYQYLMADKRKDKENIIEVIKNNGYDYVTTKGEMLKSSKPKLWGMFAPDAMTNEFDRDKQNVPSLADMSQKAIDVLSKNKKGFFLMVEGSKVDWAAHANDPIGVISEIISLNDAIKVALDFAKKDKNTIVLLVEDHGTGGITIGNAQLQKGYDNTHLSKYLDTLKKPTLTGEGVEKLIKEDKSNIKEVMAQYYGLTDLTDEEIKKISEAQKGTLNSVIGPMISKKAYIGWTTTGHTGEDVALYCYSPYPEKLSGLIENTDVAKYMESALSANLKTTTDKLFLKVSVTGDDAKALFEKTYNKKIGSIASAEQTPANPVLTITLNDGNIVAFPANKNYAVDKDNKVIKVFNGVNVYNGIDWFVSKDGIDLIK